jgi:3-methyladenine DNA glycosylase AlkD
MAKKSATKAKPNTKKAATTKKVATKRKAARAKAAPAPDLDTISPLELAIRALADLADEKTYAQNAKNSPMGSGAGNNQLGVPRGEIRKLAAKTKTNHALAMELWNTNNVDCQLLATLIMEVERLSADKLEWLVKTVTYIWVADWLHSYVVKQHPDKETLRQKWMKSSDRWIARAGWQLTAGRVAKSPEGLDLAALLDRIEKEMPTAPLETRWTMNTCLAEIGIHHPKLRKRALAIGEKLGMYRDYPCSKGCTSPFAPIWINEMVRRQG